MTKLYPFDDIKKTVHNLRGCQSSSHYQVTQLHIEQVLSMHLKLKLQNVSHDYDTRPQ